MSASSMVEKKSLKKLTKQVKTNDFEEYLQTRRENTTYNGIELETDGWQKELLGYKAK